LKEERIQQVLDLEKQASAIREAAVQEAATLPVQAERDAQALIEKARAEAEQKARELIAEAQAERESAEILAQIQEKIKRVETLATGNFDRAVDYVLARVTGRE